MKARNGLWLNAAIALGAFLISGAGTLLAQQQRVGASQRPVGPCPPAEQRPAQGGATGAAACPTPTPRTSDNVIIGDPASCPPGIADQQRDKDRDIFRFDRYDRADEDANRVATDTWIAHNGEMPKIKAPPVEFSDPDKPIPLSFIISYGLASDHVWRGINWSEYPGEGREKPNHQAGAGVEFDAGAFGVFGGTVWFDWFAGTDTMTGRSSGVPLESDYTAYWRYPIRSIGLTPEVGWSYIRFNAFEETSQELYARIQFDDSRLWGTQSAFLNPYVFYAIEYHQTDWTSWLEFGIKPRWVMADVSALAEIPVIRDMWFSPSLSVGWDFGYIGDITEVSPALPQGGREQRCANGVAGLEVGYDIGHAFNMPKEYGSVIVIGFLNYSCALGNSILSDELWGGIKVAYLW